MKIKLLSILPLILIVGCSTNPNSMRSNSPDALHSSFKNPKEIALCVGNKWESFGIVNQREISGGLSLTASLSGKLHYLTDIKSDGNTTITTAYKFMVISVGADPYLTAITECQL